MDRHYDIMTAHKAIDVNAAAVPHWNDHKHTSHVEEVVVAEAYEAEVVANLAPLDHSHARNTVLIYSYAD